MNELDIFSAALELHSMEGRARYLDEACGDHPERRRRIDELLGSHAHAGSFMNAPGQERVAQATTDEPIAERPGTIIGPTGMSRLAPSPAEIVGHEESAAVEATDSSCGQLRALIHQSPRSFGKSRSTWTLRLLAEVCAEQGIVDHQVSPSTICRTLRRMKISWKRARRWMTSPDPDYALKKARRERLIQVASKHPNWVLGFLDEVWWNRLSRPPLSTWTEGPPLKIRSLKADDDDPDPIALCCYGMLRKDTHKVMLRFIAGRPEGSYTGHFLNWLSQELHKEGKERLIVVWDDASWHACEEVLSLLKEHNSRTKKEGGVEIIHFELPTNSPWLNSIEPCWPQARKAIMEPNRKLTAQETRERVCQYFGDELRPDLRVEDALALAPSPCLFSDP